ncbi:MAG: SDR family oxidoreductase [Candidatus Paceibacterota bacterium]|jgi:3-oxoacyl-[acyl-carrier protein] reductase/2-[hydroxy(phenyl)methyl]-succinyl-CoA dehydrogenase BbsD subunit
MDIKNKVVFITGATSGIGLETAKLLLDQGCKVSTVSINIPDNLDTEVILKNPNFLVTQGDIRTKEDVEKVIEETIDKFGSIDILVNNAAVAQNKNFEETDYPDWNFIIDVNIKGTLNVIKRVLEIMKEKKSGLIVNISSGAGFYGIEGLSIYSLTKAAIINLSQSLKDELSKYNIDVFTITPGSTDTGMFKTCFPDHEPKHTPNQVAQVIVKALKKEIIPDQNLIIDVFQHQK